MSKRATLTWLLILAIVLFLASGVEAYRAMDKGFEYANDEAYRHNAYVGGDAYNYIINGTYATAYTVAATGFFLAGMGCILTRFLIRYLPDREE